MAHANSKKPVSDQAEQRGYSEACILQERAEASRVPDISGAPKAQGGRRTAGLCNNEFSFVLWQQQHIAKE